MSVPTPCIDIICSSLLAELYTNKLARGYSCCISFGVGGTLFTPCEFERKSGHGSSKNWKRSIRYKGKLIGLFLESVISLDGKQRVSFALFSAHRGRGSFSTATSTSGPVNPVTVP